MNAQQGNMNRALVEGNWELRLENTHGAVANSDELYRAFSRAVALLQVVFPGVNITFNVLGSAWKGVALAGPGLDIDVDMIFSNEYIRRWADANVLTQDHFLGFVKHVADAVKWTGVYVVPGGVSRSFSLEVHGVIIEIFPKYRSSVDPSAVISFGGATAGGSRPALGNCVPEDYVQAPFTDTSINPRNLRVAIVVLKMWKSQGGWLKSYHLPLLAESVVSGSADVPENYFALPDQNGTILSWVTALWRRIVAVRAGGAALIYQGMFLHAIDYPGGLCEDVMSPIRFLQNGRVVDAIPLEYLLGGVTMEQLRAAQGVTFRWVNPNQVHA